LVAEQSLGVRMQRLGDEFLGATVGVGGVNQVDTEPNRLTQDLACGARAPRRVPHPGQPHCAEAEPVHSSPPIAKVPEARAGVEVSCGVVVIRRDTTTSTELEVK
jgi:hypothetical protein